jgi:hypothetical protein
VWQETAAANGAQAGVSGEPSCMVLRVRSLFVSRGWCRGAVSVSERFVREGVPAQGNDSLLTVYFV